MDNEKTQRNDRGRFAPGNRGGPGRPRGHRDELRQAAEAVVSREHMEALMRRVLRSGLEGNLSAATFVWDRVCGKPTEAPPEVPPLDFELPDLRTAADCAAALAFLAKAICDGAGDRGVAKLLVDVVQARLRAIEITDLEQRLIEIEKAVDLVEPRGRRR